MLTSRVKNEQDLRVLVSRVRAAKDLEQVKQEVVLIADFCGDIFDALIRAQKKNADLEAETKTLAKEIKNLKYDLDRVKTKQGKT